MPFLWDTAIVDILERIRYNSVQLNAKHTSQYLQFAELLKYFDLPIIICSVFSSSFASLSAVNPQYQTTITTSISMFITVLSSIKLYLNLTSNINNEIMLSKSYYILSINIYKILSLRPVDMNPRLFLDEQFAEYSKLIEQSSIILKNSRKDLLTINEYCESPIGSLRSNDSFNILTEQDIL